MPDALWFTDDEAANQLLAEDPFALLVGFALDQQVTVQQAFLGPLRLKERLRPRPAVRRAQERFARLVGFAPDQQVPVQQAFLGPLGLKGRLGTLEPPAVAKADLEP